MFLKSVVRHQRGIDISPGDRQIHLTRCNTSDYMKPAVALLAGWLTL